MESISDVKTSLFRFRAAHQFATRIAEYGMSKYREMATFLALSLANGSRRIHQFKIHAASRSAALKTALLLLPPCRAARRYAIQTMEDGISKCRAMGIFRGR